MSQRNEKLVDYKGRNIGEVYNLADGGIGIDLEYESKIVLLSRETADNIFKLILDDRKERHLYRVHIGNFAGDV